MAPLPVGLALRLGGPLQDVAIVAHEAHHVIEVEPLAHRAAVDGTAWVAAAHGFVSQNTGEHLVKMGQENEDVETASSSLSDSLS